MICTECGKRLPEGAEICTGCGAVIAPGSAAAQALERGILENLGENARNFSVRVFDRLDSTNLEVKRQAENGAPEGRVVAAVSQSAGRGRLGRKFFSPADRGLYMTLLLRPAIAAEAALPVTAAAAVAVAEAAEAVAGVDARIKWVNDVYCGDRKVCGILAEAALSAGASAPDYVALGIGVNLQPPREGYGELSGIAGALFDEAPAGAAGRLAAEILTRLWAAYRSLPDVTFLDRYRARSCLTGRRVRVFCGAESYEAEVLGIDERLGLTVRTADGKIRSLSSGEVSLKPIE